MNSLNIFPKLPDDSSNGKNISTLRFIQFKYLMRIAQ